MKIGFHVSISGSIDLAVDRAQEEGCTTFQIFTRNPRGWKAKPLSDEEVKNFSVKIRSSGIWPPVGHMPYLPNLASTKDETYGPSLKTLFMEVDRSRALGIPYLVTHLGSHLGAGWDAGAERIVKACSQAARRADRQLTILLENTAGTKNSMGSTFDELKRILQMLGDAPQFGICFDTCHAFAAGYDLRTKAKVDAVIDELDRVVGLERLKVVHINDSKGELGSHLDRHEHIGLGLIGDEGFKALLRHRALTELPFILETPVDERRKDAENLRKVKELAGL